MKKVLTFIFLFIATTSIFLGSAKNTYAQDVCAAHGFGEYGCRKCAPNSADVDICQLQDQGVSPGVMCAPGADPPANATEICNSISGDPGTCNSQYIGCVPRNVGAYTCVIQGVSSQCMACDNDPLTPTPACPTGSDITIGDTYTDESACLTSCVIIDDRNYTCLRSGGSCRNPIEGGRCPDDLTQVSLTCQQSGTVCCMPSDAWPVFNAQIHGSCGADRIDTAIGCLPVTNINDLAAFVLRWGLGIVGGIGFLMIIFASIMIITSTGDPKRLQAGRELLSAAIAGILILIFSVFILRFIGFNILQIPQFGG